jgi:hypothetical protein
VFYRPIADLAGFGGTHSAVLFIDNSNENVEADETNNPVRVTFTLPAQPPVLQDEQPIALSCTAQYVDRYTTAPDLTGTLDVGWTRINYGGTAQGVTQPYVIDLHRLPDIQCTTEPAPCYGGPDGLRRKAVTFTRRTNA